MDPLPVLDITARFDYRSFTRVYPYTLEAQDTFHVGREMFEENAHLLADIVV
jgi:hypothetical protein